MESELPERRFCQICREEEEEEQDDKQNSHHISDAHGGQNKAPENSVFQGEDGNMYEQVENGLLREVSTGRLKLADDHLNPEEVLSNRLCAPCKCNGSVQYIHQSCLEQWLSISDREKCDLCGMDFQFEPVFLRQAPKELPMMQWLASAYLYFRRVRPFLLRLLFVILHWGIVSLLYMLVVGNKCY